VSATTERRLQRLEARAAVASGRQLIVVRRFRAGHPEIKLMARVVSLPDGAPTAEAAAARARLAAEGYTVREVAS
jgi:hypothetical protein